MLFFLIDIYILGFDIVPDFVGWMSMLGAVAMLTGKVKGIERIRTTAAPFNMMRFLHPHLRAGHAWV